MASLTNQKISNSYLGLLNTTSNGVLTSSLAQITDGNGNGSPIYLSTAALNLYNKYTFPDAVPASGTFLKATDGSGTLAWVAESGGDVKKTGTITINTIAVWNDATETLRSEPAMTINPNGTISLTQPNSSAAATGSFNIGGGNIATVAGSNNAGFGNNNLANVTSGGNNVAIGNFALQDTTIGSNNTAVGTNALADHTEGDGNVAVGAEALTDVRVGGNNTAVGRSAGANIDGTSGNTVIGKNAGFSLDGTGTQATNNTFIGVDSGTSVTSGSKNVILGSNSGGTIATSSNNIIISDGDGNARIQVDSSGIVGIGSTGIFAGTNAILNLQGSGIAIKNDRNGSNNNWSYIQNDGTGSDATIILSTGNALPAMKLAHNGDATFSGDVNVFKSSAILAIGESGSGGSFGFINWDDSDDFLYLGNSYGGAFNKNIVISSSGKIGINTSTSSVISVGSLNVKATATGVAFGCNVYNSADETKYTYLTHNGTKGLIGTSYLSGAYTDLSLQTSEADRLTITASNGFTKIKANGGNSFDAATYNEIVNNNNTSGDTILIIGNNAGTATNNSSSHFLFCADTGGTRMEIEGNGDLKNANNTYGAISDIKLKENIIDATPKLDDLLKVKIKNFNFIGTDNKQIGVIAQELEEVFPAMVSNSIDWKEEEIEDEEGNTKTIKVDSGTVTKSVKYSVFVPILIKAIQEQQVIINDLKSKIEKLEL